MRYAIIVLVGVLIFILQLFIAPLISIAGISPDFVLIYLSCLSVYFNMPPLAACGAFIGAAIDITTAGDNFLYTAIYLTVGVALGIVRLFKIDIDFIGSLIAVISAVIFKYIVIIFAMYILEFSETISIEYFLKGIPSGIYSILILPVFFFLIRLIMEVKLKRKKDENILPN